MGNDELRVAMRRLMRAAFPPDGREGVTVPPEDLRAVLQLVKRLKNRTPADGCVVCRHKDREHRGDGACMAPLDPGPRPLPMHPNAGTLLCKCDEFVPVADVPFDNPEYNADWGTPIDRPIRIPIVGHIDEGGQVHMREQPKGEEGDGG